MSAKNGALLVEGRDDQHVIWCLLKHHRFPEVFDVLEKNGAENVLKVLPVQLKASGMRAVGVMLDADIDINARWTQLKSILETAGYGAVPDEPVQSGAVIEQDQLPKVGVWLMPDNLISGMLEDFVSYLVPPEDPVMPEAKAAVARAAELPAPFKLGHLAKAQIHTWLAWQADPGTPLGQAITKKYLDPNAPSARKFMEWIEQVFVH